jgi:hypothetical protein
MRDSIICDLLTFKIAFSVKQWMQRVTKKSSFFYFNAKIDVELVKEFDEFKETEDLVEYV